MFPFRFDKIDSSTLSLNDRIKIDNTLHSKLEKSMWRYTPFNVDEKVSNYNEYSYFYDFARNSIYNKEKSFKEKEIVYFYRKNIHKESFVKIKKHKGNEYILALKAISLRLYNTGVAILSFDIENDKYSNLDDILNINELFRRVYPQFLGKEGVENTKEANMLADSITISSKEFIIFEDFTEIYSKTPNETYLSKIVTVSLGVDIFTQNEEEIGKYLISPIVDDRMFVLSWYGNNDFAAELKEFNETVQEYNYLENDNWYKYLFVDTNDKTVQNRLMQKELVKDATYARWIEYGTLYGVSHYSFVCVSDNSEFTRETLPLPHMKSMYYQMMHLILAQRASILRFSQEVASITIKDFESKISKKIESAQEVYENYIRFMNKLYARNITAQEQGVELYKMVQKVMNLEQEVKELNLEIQELHNYIEMKQEKQRNERLEQISVLGALFLPPTLLAGLFGMNIIEFEQHSLAFTFWAIFLMFASSVVGYLLMIKVNSAKWKMAGTFAMIFAFCAFVYMYPATKLDNHKSKPIQVKENKKLKEHK